MVPAPVPLTTVSTEQVWEFFSNIKLQERERKEALRRDRTSLF